MIIILHLQGYFAKQLFPDPLSFERAGQSEFRASIPFQLRESARNYLNFDSILN
jgi:hypothetical protein